MTSYTIFQPPVPALDSVSRSDELVFVKEGFSWAAFLIPLIWLVYHRVWIGLGLMLAISIVINVIFESLRSPEIYATLAFLAISLIVAFEGNAMRRWQLSRRDYRLIGVVSGRNLSECEEIFFRIHGDEILAEPADSSQDMGQTLSLPLMPGSSSKPSSLHDEQIKTSWI
ncbi:MAG: DUF2628 domain-containing protein [Pseudomonadota bacterium]